MIRTLLCLLFAAGCDGSTTTPMGNQVNGTVDGIGVSALGAIFARDSYDDSNGVHRELAHVLVGESADLCAIARGSFIGKKNSHVLTLDFEGPDNSSELVGPGDYPEWIPSGSGGRSGVNVVAGLVSVGDACDYNVSGGPGGLGNGGSVKLVTSTNLSMTGTFSLSFATGQISGSFDATVCQAYILGTDQSPCQ